MYYWFCMDAMTIRILHHNVGDPMALMVLYMEPAWPPSFALLTCVRCANIRKLTSHQQWPKDKLVLGPNLFFFSFLRNIFYECRNSRESLTLPTQNPGGRIQASCRSTLNGTQRPYRSNPYLTTKCGLGCLPIRPFTFVPSPVFQIYIHYPLLPLTIPTSHHDQTHRRRQSRRD